MGGGQDLGSPSCPPTPSYSHPLGGQNWLLRWWKVGILGDPTYTLEIIPGDPHPFIMPMEAGRFGGGRTVWRSEEGGECSRCVNQRGAKAEGRV